MFTYRTPGVYFEWLDDRPPPLVPLRTDIAGFVGIAARGPLHEPVKVESWTQFISTFGAHIPQGYLAYAIEGFFANGGQTCWVVRVADPESTCPANLLLVGEQQTVRLSASSPGVWGQDVVASVIRTGGGFTLTLRLSDGGQEVWRNLTVDQADRRYVKAVLNDPQSGSHLVTVCDQEPSDGWPQDTPRLQLFESRVVTGRLLGGQDGLKGLSPDHFHQALAALEAIDEVSIVAMPDIMPKLDIKAVYKEQPRRCHVLDTEPVPPSAPETELEFPPIFSDEQIFELQNALIGHCEKLKDRVAILDPHHIDLTPPDAIGQRNQFDTKYAALYYPWLKVPDPLRLEGLLRPVPPSGHVAGVYARGDRLVGVHKPPANKALEAVKDVLGPVSEVDHGDLNVHDVNVIRSYNGRGVRVAGARTLSRDSEWRYVNVRRLLIMIEEGIDEQLQWMAFEPNNPNLWRDVDRVVRSFLDHLWQRGMLEGATAGEAYSVVCDETTNPPEETERGRIICEIGVWPPWPAEFVIVRIGKTESGTEILEEIGAQNG